MPVAHLPTRDWLTGECVQCALTSTAANGGGDLKYSRWSFFAEFFLKPAKDDLRPLTISETLPISTVQFTDKIIRNGPQEVQV